MVLRLVVVLLANLLSSHFSSDMFCLCEEFGKSGLGAELSFEYNCELTIVSKSIIC